MNGDEIAGWRNAVLENLAEIKARTGRIEERQLRFGDRFGHVEGRLSVVEARCESRAHVAGDLRENDEELEERVEVLERAHVEHATEHRSIGRGIRVAWALVLASPVVAGVASWAWRAFAG